MRTNRLNRKIRVAAALIGCCGIAMTAQAVDTPEVEPNNNKATANAVTLAPADSVSGTTTGTSTTTAGIASADYYRVKTPAQALGIYKHQLALTSSPVGTHTFALTLRGLTQTANTINATSDVAFQTASTSTTPRLNITWYGFGKEEEVYAAVTGTGTTTDTYTLTKSQVSVTPQVASGTILAGPVQIRAVGLSSTSLDTDMWIYDSNFNPLISNVPAGSGPGGADNQLTAGGPTGTNASMTRTLPAGTYYMAVGTYNVGNDQPSPAGDFTVPNALDFPNAIAASPVNRTTAATLNLQFTDAYGSPVVVSPTVTLPVGGVGDIGFVQFTVSSVNFPIATAIASPTSGSTGTSVTFTISVTPAPGSNLDNITSVTLDASAITGNASPDTVTLTRVGSSADWTGSAVIGSVTTGAKSLPYTIVDSGGAANGTGSVSVTVTPAAPSNNTCGTALPIAGVPYTSGPIAIGGAVADSTINPSCDNSANGAAAPNATWFSFTPSTSGGYTFRETTSTDAVLTIWTGACGGGQTQFACDDSAIEGTTGYVGQLVGGTQYFVALSRYTGTAGAVTDNIDLTVGQIAPPVNDTCATAISVPVPGASYSQTAVEVRGATSDIDVSCNAPAATATINGIWHTFTPPAGDTYMVTIGQTNSTPDTIRAVFVGTCSGLSQVACFDTETGNQFFATGGVTYYVLTGMYSATVAPTTTFTVTISSAVATSACCTSTTCSVLSNSACTTAGGTWRGPLSVTCSVATNAANACQPTPANDTCATATPIVGSLPQTFTTAFPAAANDDIKTCSSTAAPATNTRFGVWYSYTTGVDSGVLNYSETNSSVDNAIAAFSGTCSGLTQIACSDPETGLTLSLNANSTYYILVGAYSNTTTPSSAYTFVANSFTAATGACCDGTSCSIVMASACSGIFLGAGTTCDAIPTVFENANATIPDATEPSGGPNTITPLVRTITSTDNSTISTVGLRLNITHDFVGDLRVTLTGPNGSTVTVVDRVASATTCVADYAIGSGNDIGGIYVFSDAATTGFDTAALAQTTGDLPSGNYFAQTCDGTAVSLSAPFVGTSAAGTWTLQVSDRDSALVGTLFDWGVVINGVQASPCSNVGSCCIGSACSIVANAAACSGTYTAGGTCSPNPCVSSNVVCCRGTTCTTVPAVDCTVPALPVVGVSQSAAAACGVNNSTANGCCFADFTKSSGVNIDDIFVYLNAWFASSPYTDMGGNGTTGPNIDDIFIYLNAWFAGCPN